MLKEWLMMEIERLDQGMSKKKSNERVQSGLEIIETDVPGFVWKRLPDGSYTGDMKDLLKDYDPNEPYPDPKTIKQKYGLK